MIPKREKLLDAGTGNPIVNSLLRQFVEILNKSRLDSKIPESNLLFDELVALTKALLECEKRFCAYVADEARELQEIDQKAANFIPGNGQIRVVISEAARQAACGFFVSASEALKLLWQITGRILGRQIGGYSSRQIMSA